MLEEIIKKCKCGVFLEVNLYLNYYQSIEEAIEEENLRHSRPEIDKELAERMVKENMYVTLQFYPDTPVGFYRVYGTSLEEVYAKAKKCLSL